LCRFQIFTSNNNVSLKSGLDVIQGNSNWYHSIDRTRVPIHLPLQLWLYLYRFGDKARLRRKSRFFSYPLLQNNIWEKGYEYFCAIFHNRATPIVYRVMQIDSAKSPVFTHSSRWLQTVRRTDRRTDRRKCGFKSGAVTMSNVRK